MINKYGRPIRIFYANLLRHGIILSVDAGKLRVSGAIENLSLSYRDEIKRRARHLMEFLQPQPPDDLKPFFHRLISVDEVVQAMGIAARLGVNVKQTPVDGGWLLEMGEGSPHAPPKKRT